MRLSLVINPTQSTCGEVTWYVVFASICSSQRFQYSVEALAEPSKLFHFLLYYAFHNERRNQNESAWRSEICSRLEINMKGNRSETGGALELSNLIRQTRSATRSGEREEWFSFLPTNHREKKASEQLFVFIERCRKKPSRALRG
jgi:hypothetical protein